MPHLFLLLKENNQSAIADVLVKSKSRMELMSAGLRARIKK
jgi:hypothetical protein